jgi:hypothetical protein
MVMVVMHALPLWWVRTWRIELRAGRALTEPAQAEPTRVFVHDACAVCAGAGSFEHDVLCGRERVQVGRAARYSNTQHLTTHSTRYSSTQHLTTQHTPATYPWD